MIKKFKLGKFANPLPDYGGKFLNIEIRLSQIEKALDIQNDPNFTVASLTSIRPIQMSIKGESSDTSPGNCIASAIPISAPVPNIQEDIEKDIEHDEVVKMPLCESKIIMKIPKKEKRILKIKEKKRISKTKREKKRISKTK